MSSDLPLEAAPRRTPARCHCTHWEPRNKRAPRHLGALQDYILNLLGVNYISTRNKGALQDYILNLLGVNYISTRNKGVR